MYYHQANRVMIRLLASHSFVQDVHVKPISHREGERLPKFSKCTCMYMCLCMCDSRCLFIFSLLLNHSHNQLKNDSQTNAFSFSLFLASNHTAQHILSTLHSPSMKTCPQKGFLPSGCVRKENRLINSLTGVE